MSKTVRIDKDRFYEGTCKKCKQFTGDKPVFGKCLGDRMLSCARMRLFNLEEFENYTGIRVIKKEKMNER